MMNFAFKMNYHDVTFDQPASGGVIALVKSKRPEWLNWLAAQEPGTGPWTARDPARHEEAACLKFLGSVGVRLYIDMRFFPGK